MTDATVPRILPPMLALMLGSGLPAVASQSAYLTGAAYPNYPLIYRDGPGYGPSIRPPMRRPGMACGQRMAPSRMRGGMPYYTNPPAGMAAYGAPAIATAQRESDADSITPGVKAGASRVEQSAAAATVQIAGMAFSPALVTIESGGSVTWDQSAAMPHTVTAADGGFSSKRMTAGNSYTRVFDEPGTYTYYCSVHPSMRGEIVVN